MTGRPGPIAARPPPCPTRAVGVRLRAALGLGGPLALAHRLTLRCGAHRRRLARRRRAGALEQLVVTASAQRRDARRGAAPAWLETVGAVEHDPEDAHARPAQLVGRGGEHVAIDDLEVDDHDHAVERLGHDGRVGADRHRRCVDDDVVPGLAHALQQPRDAAQPDRRGRRLRQRRPGGDEPHPRVRGLLKQGRRLVGAVDDVDDARRHVPVQIAVQRGPAQVAVDRDHIAAARGQRVAQPDGDDALAVPRCRADEPDHASAARVLAQLQVRAQEVQRLAEVLAPGRRLAAVRDAREDVRRDDRLEVLFVLDRAVLAAQDGGETDAEQRPEQEPDEAVQQRVGRAAPGRRDGRLGDVDVAGLQRLLDLQLLGAGLQRGRRGRRRLGLHALVDRVDHALYAVLRAPAAQRDDLAGEGVGHPRRLGGAVAGRRDGDDVGLALGRQRDAFAQVLHRQAAAQPPADDGCRRVGGGLGEGEVRRRRALRRRRDFRPARRRVDPRRGIGGLEDEPRGRLVLRRHQRRDGERERADDDRDDRDQPRAPADAARHGRDGRRPRVLALGQTYLRDNATGAL